MKSILALLVFVIATVAGFAVFAQRGPQTVARDTFRTADQFDRADVASMRAARDQWVAAFAQGNPKPVEFMFANDAVINMPVSPPPAELFTRYQAKLVFDYGFVFGACAKA
jgi:hypothetical protein